MDELIHSQSEAYQSQFLQGSIPKVIFKHAMKGSSQPALLFIECDDIHLATSLLQISFELGNTFVEQFILQDLLDNHWTVLLLFIFSLAGPFSLECAHSLSSLARRPSAFS